MKMPLRHEITVQHMIDYYLSLDLDLVKRVDLVVI
jgi:hypothetical protein